MIEVGFLTHTGGLLGFHITGHAGGAAGTDIVCAAVSSAAYLVANTVTEVMGAVPRELTAEEGDMLLRLSLEDVPKCRTVLLGLRLHLTGLEEQYPEDIRVSYMEI